MTNHTLSAMGLALAVILTAFAIRVVYVVVLYERWTLAELLGFADQGWETDDMRENRRSFWR